MRSLVVILFALGASVGASVPAVAQDPGTPTTPPAPTWFKDIQPLVHDHCQQCHRPNDIAPFALLTYDDAVAYSDDIRVQVASKAMPPWKPRPGYGDFKDNYGLTDDQRAMLLAWIDNGVPQGDPNDAAPVDPPSTSPWQLGTPDLTLTAPAFTPPHVTDTYRCFSLDPGFDTAHYINASQMIPGDAQEVHHIILYLDQNGDSAKLDGQDGQPGYTCFGGPGVSGFSGNSFNLSGFLGAWVPGMRIRRLDDGIGMLIPAKSRIVMQVHYHPGGRPDLDQTQAGFYFMPAENVKHRLLTLPVVNTSFNIPADANSYTVKASLSVPFFLSGKAVLVMPHMHLLGRTIQLEVDNPDKTVTPMVAIDDWDFNWQNSYTFTNQLPIVGGSVIRLTSVYDNSDGNPKNPNNPIVPVRWGEGTNDEMCLAFVGVILDNEWFLSFLSVL